MGVSSHDKHMIRLEAAGMFFWLLKDMGWTLLLPVVSFPAALAAICMESHVLLLTWGSSTPGLRAHGVAVALWLLGNSIWMAFELLFLESPERGRSFLWYSGPLAGADEKAYNLGLLWATAMFGGALAVLLVYYPWAAVLSWRTPVRMNNPQDALMNNPQDALEVSTEEEELIFGVVTPEVYKWVFIGPWIVKDLFWTWELLVPGLVCGMLVAALMIDYLRRFRTLFNVAELLWLAGNTMWMVGELALEDKVQWPRLVSASLLFAGMALSVVEFALVSVPGFEDTGKDANERRPLIGGPGASSGGSRAGGAQ